MLKDKNNQLSIYSILYNKTQKTHTLQLINEAIDLTFVTKLLEESYSKTQGRPAKNPELMLRILILQYLYDLSDERIIEEASLNLAYMWFLGINPDEDLIEIGDKKVHYFSGLGQTPLITFIYFSRLD